MDEANSVRLTQLKVNSSGGPQAAELHRLHEQNEATQVENRRLYERIEELLLANQELLEVLKEARRRVGDPMLSYAIEADIDVAIAKYGETK